MIMSISHSLVNSHILCSQVFQVKFRGYFPCRIGELVPVSSDRSTPEIIMRSLSEFCFLIAFER